MASPSAGIQSIERAFSVLLAIATESAGITDVSRRVGLPVSTVARLLNTLEQLQAVVRQDDGVSYRIGPTVSLLALRSDTTLASRATPFLSELVERLGETSGLSIAEQGEVLYLDHVGADQAVQIQDWTGKRLPMHVVSSGLVLLAFGPAERTDAALASGLQQFTPLTTTDPLRLLARLQDVRANGFVWTAEEFQLGITSIAAPVFNTNGEIIAAIHVHGPSYRFPGEHDRRQVEQAITDAARRLTATAID